MNFRERIKIHCFCDRPVYMTYAPYSHRKITVTNMSRSKIQTNPRLFIPLNF